VTRITLSGSLATGKAPPTVRDALGHGKAMAVLIPGFALYHGLDPQQLLGMLAGGTALLLLRLHRDAL
jgi:hypothetical protein